MGRPQRNGDYYLHPEFHAPKTKKQVEQKGEDEGREIIGVDVGVVLIVTTLTT